MGKFGQFSSLLSFKRDPSLSLYSLRWHTVTQACIPHSGADCAVTVDRAVGQDAALRVLCMPSGPPNRPGPLGAINMPAVM